MSDNEFEKLDEKFDILPLVVSPLFNNMMYQTSLNTSTCSSDAPIIFTEPKLTLLIPEEKKGKAIIPDLDFVQSQITRSKHINNC
jgi:hypothetical protein